MVPFRVNLFNFTGEDPTSRESLAGARNILEAENRERLRFLSERDRTKLLLLDDDASEEVERESISLELREDPAERAKLLLPIIVLFFLGRNQPECSG